MPAIRTAAITSGLIPFDAPATKFPLLALSREAPLGGNRPDADNVAG